MLSKIFSIFALSLSVACSTSSPEPLLFSSLGTSALWRMHSLESDAKRLALIEVELAKRGQSSFGLDHLGRRTAAAYGKKLYGRNEPSHDDMNCSDFANPALAQSYFLKNGGPVSDPSGLDGDGDGLACEWGTHIKKVVRRHTAPVPKPRRTYSTASRRCYVGPRGGTYTLTASGNKNYSGC